MGHGFFNTVQYVGTQDNSWYGYAERAADICRAPRRWLLTDLGYHNKEYMITIIGGNLTILENETSKSEGLKKTIRMVVSVVCIIPGEMLASALMPAAYASPEIRLKHAFSERKLTNEEQQKLKQAMDARNNLAQERQGCDPISCSLVTIICLLCSIVRA